MTYKFVWHKNDKIKANQQKLKIMSEIKIKPLADRVVIEPAPAEEKLQVEL